ncbi:B3 domain-containing protein [Raphanus sativus]|nr:B3 domain-containing protein [Raphanus sativus]
MRLLVLPSDYRQYYPTPLPQTAVLRKPEGIFWTVKWAISPEEEISFGDGWSKFIADNGPIDRDFLIFSYDGSRSFLVSIFRNGLPVKPEAPVTIQEISDDDEEDEAADNDGEKDGDHDQNMMITSLSLGSSDEEYNADTTVIAMQVIKDYDLKFDGIIKFIDGFGELEGKIGNWKDRVVVYPWQVIYSRNDAKPGDVIICEILREGDVVRSIKAHFVKK